MSAFIASAAPSPHWWVTGWAVSIGLLALGFIIAQYYYSGAKSGGGV